LHHRHTGKDQSDIKGEMDRIVTGQTLRKSGRVFWHGFFLCAHEFAISHLS
jgi:hypothetical protein